MKKREMNVIFGSILVILFLGMVFAANETNSTSTTSSTTNSGAIAKDYDDAIEKAYACLADQVKDKTTLSLQEAVFATLALGSKSNLADKIESEKKDVCWPKANCNLKETAQAALAYDTMNKDTKKIEDWLLSKNASTNELTWYLEIDISSHVASECTITYDGTARKINIGNDMKLTGNPGNCLSVSGSGYWLTIRDSCLDKTLDISCNQDFITTLLYQKRTGDTIYVSSDTHSQASLGTTSERVEAKCFRTGNTCDYEGSLWAAAALHELGRDVSSFVPYLIALSDDNKKYFPSSFIYIINAGEDQYSSIIDAQKSGKYWENTGSTYGRYYDTSLAMLALGGTSSNELINAQNYLISVQTKDGCWNNNNIRDTAFILYSGWPKRTPSSGGGGSSGSLCEAAGSARSCELNSACIGAGGSVLYDYACTTFSEFCCSVKVPQLSCNQKGGVICASNQECKDNSIIPSSDGSCCKSACINVQQENVCERFGGTCRSSSCQDGESQNTDSCIASGEICCVEDETPDTPSEKGINWIWIIIIGILILLVIIAIVMRNKIRLWWFKYRGRAKSSPIVRPGFPPAGSPIRMPSAMAVRPAPRYYPAPVRRQPSPKDREMDDTLKKLREMSK